MPKRDLGFKDQTHLLWWLFVASRGGEMRLRIVEELLKSPANANQLAGRLSVNYRTVKHHLDILVDSGLVIAEGPKYGQLYYPSELLLKSIDVIRRMVREARGNGP